MPTQELMYEYEGKEYTAKLHFNDNIIKHQNNHIYQMSLYQALCLTIADCKQFIKQYYKSNITKNNWWIPKEYGMASKNICHRALINFNMIIKQMEITQCIQ